MKKTVTIALTIVMILALALPAFADSVTYGIYPRPEIIITNGNANDSIVPGLIEYELILHGPKALDIKVGGRPLKISDFKKYDDNTFIYKGSCSLGLTESFRVYVYDLYHTGDATFEKEFKFTVDAIAPKLSVYVSKPLDNGFNVCVLSIEAADNYGIDSIAVDGKTIANQSKTQGKKLYEDYCNVLSAGTHIVSVRDIAGNTSFAYVTISTDGTSSVNYLGGNSIWGAGYPYGSFSSYFYNPQMYYYSRLYGKGELDNTWFFWYLLNQNPAKETETTTPAATSTIPAYTNWYYLYSLLNKNDNLCFSDRYLYWALLSGSFGSADSTSYLTSLINAGTLDMNPTLFYYILNGGNDLNIDENFFAYQYYFGNLMQPICGNDISHFTKDGVLTLTAPMVKEKSVSYRWQKYENYAWVNIGSNSESIAVTPKTGDKYRVILSSEFYYRPVCSDVLIVTDDMLKDSEVTPAPTPAPSPAPCPVPVEEYDSTVFTAKDILINGKTYTYVRVKLGNRISLCPNVNGYWIFNPNEFAGFAGTNVILSPLKTGTYYLVFKGTDGKGHTASKVITVEVTE